MTRNIENRSWQSSKYCIPVNNLLQSLVVKPILQRSSWWKQTSNSFMNEKASYTYNIFQEKLIQPTFLESNKYLDIET